MILKKLREKRGWSQEHLARSSGLSVRTIQRVEGGAKASLESLMSLASTLEVDIETLKQEIAVIDKNTKEWREMPLLAKLALTDTYLPWIGIKHRKQYQRIELAFAISGLASLPLSFFDAKFGQVGLILMVGAYAYSIAIRVGDKYKIW